MGKADIKISIGYLYATSTVIVCMPKTICFHQIYLLLCMRHTSSLSLYLKEWHYAGKPATFPPPCLCSLSWLFCFFKHKFSLTYPIMFWRNYLRKKLPSPTGKHAPFKKQQPTPKSIAARWAMKGEWFEQLIMTSIPATWQVHSQSKKKKKLTERTKVILSLFQLFKKISYSFLCMNLTAKLWQDWYIRKDSMCI